MRDHNTLDTLFPGPRRQILTAMFGEPSRWWSLPELAGRAGIQPASLRQHMTQLREAGAVREKAEAGGQCFQPDRACPVFEEFRTILSKLTSEADSAETILVV